MQTASAAQPARLPDESPQPRFYHPELDVLRFFAFFAVFITHSLPKDAAIYERHRLPHAIAMLFSSTVRAGVFGVDLFFVLSAYLITELLLREQQATGTLRVPHFYARRALRIWPLYFSFLVLAVVLARGGFGPAFGWGQALAFAGFCGNWYFVFHGVGEGMVGPLWSVSVEEQFYLTWPWLVRWIPLKRLSLAALGLLMIAVAARALAVAHNMSEFVLWKNTFTRLDPIACGALLALLLRRQEVRLKVWHRAALLLAALAALLATAHLGDGSDFIVPPHQVWFGYPVAALACSAIFLAVFKPVSGSLPAITRPLVYFGKISYGLYVFHLLALGICLKLFAPFLKSFAGLGAYWCTAFLLNLALAALSYRYMESPFLRFKERFARVASRPV